MRCCLSFLQETYAAAADLAKWDRKALERQSQRDSLARRERRSMLSASDSAALLERDYFALA